MKQLLFLLLFPAYAMAQYPGNAGQKITLGEQTTADGLVYRGVAADTTRKPSVDTMAYILLDTNTNIIWQYKKATSNAWLRLNLLPSDTTSMLTNYYRSGLALGTPTSGTVTNLTGTASININGTVGATTPNTGAFTTVAASSDVTLSGGTANGVTYLNGSKVLTSGSALTFNGTNLGIGTSSPGGRLEIFQTSTTTPALRLRYNSTSYFGDHVLAPSGAYTIYSPTANGVTNGVLLLRAGNWIDFATNNNPHSAVQMTLTASGQLGLGVTATNTTAVLHLKAGTATASTAPLKFTSGVNLTTAEAGAMEFNGTNLFFSPSTTRHTVNHGLTGSATLDFPSTTTLLSADLTITVTGATDGDVVSLGVPNASVNANTSYSAWVSAANTVTVRFNNYSSGTVNPASGTFKVFVTK